MSLIRATGVTILAAFTLSACAAPGISCPPQYKVDGKDHSLAGASVFEGPPQNLVDLMPDLETSEWDISMNQRAAKSRGESMYLVCHYQGLAATVPLQVPDGATACKVEGSATGFAAGCKAPHKSPSQKQD